MQEKDEQIWFIFLTKLEGGAKAPTGILLKQIKGRKQYKVREGRRTVHITAPSSLFKKQRKRKKLSPA